MSAAPASAGALWIEWDPSPDPSAIGYRVSVGTAPGVYTATFDVGSATSFVYLSPDEGLYYVAVAAYAAGGKIGPLSEPVSGHPRPVTDPLSYYEALWRNSAAARTSRNLPRIEAESVSRRPWAVSTTSLPSSVCWQSSSPCLAVRTLARRSGEISSMAASADGRLFFVEGSRSIGVVSTGAVSTGASQQTVLAADSEAVRIHQVALDPTFATTGLLFVGETEAQFGDVREFRVVRHRIARNRAVDRSVLVRVPVPAIGQPRFSVGGGRIDVAVPANIDGAPAAGLGGMVLRFNLDGTVPRDNPTGSAIIAMGYPNPTALTLDERTGLLWLAGSDDRNRHWMSSLGGLATPLPVSATSLTVADAGGSTFFMALANGRLGRAQATEQGLVTLGSQLAIGNGSIRAVATSPSGDLFAAVVDPAGSLGTSIVQLTPVR